MQAKRPWHRHPVVVPGLLVLHLLLATMLPSQWPTFLLVLAILAAARLWGVRGGLLVALLCGPALAYSLLQEYGGAFLHNPVPFAGYGWLWMALLLVGAAVGRYTEQSQALAAVNVDLKRAQERLHALHYIALSLSTTVDADRLMETIVEQVGQLWGYDHSAIVLLDEDAGDMVVAAQHGYQVPVGTRLSVESGICGAVVKSGKPIYLPDVTSDPRYVAEIPGVRSELAVPLIWEGQILGMINVESSEPDAYGPNDLTLLRTVSEQAAAAIGNARLHHRTRQMAITDPHTGLFNYRHFQDQLAQAVRDAQASSAQCSLIMIDLDHFKLCNDTYGHPTGDHVLKQVAQVLQETCRHEDLLFRYGGEEFAVLLSGASTEAAVRLAERIRHRIASQTFTTGSGRPLEISLSASLGVACYPDDSLTPVDLLLAADQALYTAKSTGRDQVVTYQAAEERPH